MQALRIGTLLHDFIDFGKVADRAQYQAVQKQNQQHNHQAEKAQTEQNEGQILLQHIITLCLLLNQFLFGEAVAGGVGRLLGFQAVVAIQKFVILRIS